MRVIKTTTTAATTTATATVHYYCYQHKRTTTSIPSLDRKQSNLSPFYPRNQSPPSPPPQQQQKQAEKEDCDACLYTGIATCTGLSFYFAKLALLDTPDITKDMSLKVARGHRNSRAGFLVVSTLWVAAGAYRWHLG